MSLFTTHQVILIATPWCSVVSSLLHFSTPFPCVLIISYLSVESETSADGDSGSMRFPSLYVPKSFLFGSFFLSLAVDSFLYLPFVLNVGSHLQMALTDVRRFSCNITVELQRHVILKQE